MGQVDTKLGGIVTAEGDGRTCSLSPLRPVPSSSSSSMTHYPALQPALLLLGLGLSQELLDTRIRAHLLCQAPSKVRRAECGEAKGRESSVLVLCSLLSQLLSQSPVPLWYTPRSYHRKPSQGLFPLAILSFPLL